MRKFLISFLSLAFVICLTFGLTACGNKTEELPDLADCEIGYQLPVYPGVEFDYKVNSDCTVHINSIVATLTEKNQISEGETLTEPFRPYTFHITAIGTTDSKFAGKKIYLRLTVGGMYHSFSFYYSTDIGSDGSIRWDYDQKTWGSSTHIYFYEVSFEG